jgi:hypothetical protein
MPIVEVKPGDEFVPDVAVCRELGITPMTLYRWDHRPELGFPPKIKIGDRCYRDRAQLSEFKQRMLREAVARASSEGKKRRVA